MPLLRVRLFVEGVRYFSWGAWYEPGLIDTRKYPHSVVMEEEGPNDGLVSVESSKWVCHSFIF
jgi:triacylglycerol lipase